ncbi:MAG: histidine phosphatase family protein [Rhodospirillales bacterium]|nr:phosphoglycerate mutase [Rhodospirillaceae bacterium]MDP6426396.1 histidine phosphatase family protein [Rhodospirillales bacterium]MDP6645743.1 histidine phosphatase family protein [Rhodospirillales bacterium]MDP6840317.1 histidine phosphatase family protein [Rhodospirillales bacterium]
MSSIAFIRHGITDWNIQGLVQGSTDIPLGEEGRAEIAAWRVPPEFGGFDWLSSPLRRAQETAATLSGMTPPTDARLAEMAWGSWEGRTLEDLRAELGDLMVAWEAKGLDFQGPGGESPRHVQARLGPLFKEIAATGRDVIAVTHKGVMRAAYAMAIGWDMADKPPDKMHEGCMHLFNLGGDGAPSVARLNIPLVPE